MQAVLQVVLTTSLLCYLIGYLAATGVLFMLLLLVYSLSMGHACAILRMKTAEVTDRRLGIINAIVSGIRTVKMYAWEWSFHENVSQIRR